MTAWFVALLEVLAWLQSGMSETRALVAGGAVMLVWLMGMFALAAWTDHLRRRRQ